MIDILSNDTDPLGALSPQNNPSSYTINIVSQPEHGELTVDNNKLKYIPENIAGQVKIDYKINNGQDSNVASVLVDVSFNEFLGSIFVDRKFPRIPRSSVT